MVTQAEQDIIDRLNAARAAQYGTGVANAMSAADASIGLIRPGGVASGAFDDPSDPKVLVRRGHRPGTHVATGSVNAAEADLAPNHVFVPASKAVNQIFESDSYREQVAKQMIAAGILDPSQEHDLFAITDAWTKVVDQAAMFQTAGAGKTPLEVLKLIRVQQKATAARKAATTTDDQTSVQHWSDAPTAVKDVLQRMLGRDPTDAEQATYQAGLNAAAAANPTRQHTVNHVDAQGNTTSSTTSSGGIDPTQVLGSMAERDPEYGAYQASTTYMDALKQAIGAFV